MYRVADARRAVSTADDVRQALYRAAQLVLRAVVGAREPDTFLMEKDGVASELADTVRARAQVLGVELIAVVSAGQSDCLFVFKNARAARGEIRCKHLLTRPSAS